MQKTKKPFKPTPKKQDPKGKYRKCPKCGKLHLSEDPFCEHCLADLTELEKQDYYARWMQ